MKSIPLFLLILGGVSVTFGHGISGADHQSVLEGGNLAYLWLGAKHMLTGYDHLLFIFGVIFFLTGFKDILKYITLFTLGHSLTLIFATVFQISANYYLIDAVIALSVCYKGFDNLDGFRKWLNVKPPYLATAIFLFGLIHGFGLSTRLQQLPLGHEGLFLRILSFNVGVEVGQVMALSVILLALAGWRRSKSFPVFSGIANLLLIACGALLFLLQIHAYAHTRHPGAFGFNEEAHYTTRLIDIAS